jgi:hypothetical protein
VRAEKGAETGLDLANQIAEQKKHARCWQVMFWIVKPVYVGQASGRRSNGSG